MDLSNMGSVFSVWAAFFGGRNTLEPKNVKKNFKSLSESTQNAGCITEMQVFSKWLPTCLDNVFLPLAGRSKKSEPRRPKIEDFWEAGVAPGPS